MRLSPASGTKAKAHVDVEQLGQDGEDFPGSTVDWDRVVPPQLLLRPPTASSSLDPGCATAPPGHPTARPGYIEAFPGHGTSWPCHCASWSCFDNSRPTPWHFPDTSWPLLAPLSPGGSLPCLEALSSLSLPGLSLFPTGWERPGIIPRTVGGEGRSCPLCPALL